MKFQFLLAAASSLVVFAMTARSDNASDLAALRANCQLASAEFQTAFTAWANAQKYSTDTALIREKEIAFWQADRRMLDLAAEARKLTLAEDGLKSGTEPLDATQARPRAVTKAVTTNSQ